MALRKRGEGASETPTEKEELFAPPATEKGETHAERMSKLKNFTQKNLKNPAEGIDESLRNNVNSGDIEGAREQMVALIETLITLHRLYGASKGDRRVETLYYNKLSEIVRDNPMTAVSLIANGIDALSFLKGNNER